MRIVLRLVRERASDGLPDPPGRIGRELEAPAPVELLDRANQPQRALLDEIEEGETLVSVVLGDGDDQSQVGLDHPLLGLHVAALDALRELDLLRSGEQLMPAGFAQEELERVRRRLHGCRDRRDDLRLRGLLDDLDRPLVQLAQERVVLELGQLVDLGDLCELRGAHGSHLLGLLEQLADVLDGEDVLDVGLTQDAAGREAVAVERTLSRIRIPHV